MPSLNRRRAADDALELLNVICDEGEVETDFAAVIDEDPEMLPDKLI